MLTQEQLDHALVDGQSESRHNRFRASSWSACDRAIWLNIRNASKVQHKAETLRTFDIGHRLEDMIVDNIRKAGYSVSHQQGAIKNKWGGEFGHIDGVISKGQWYALLEIKTAKTERWKDWKKKGIPESYHAQAQIYMHHSKQLSTKGNQLTQCVFVVLNKNTSEMHVEYLDYDQAFAESQMERIYNTVESESMPDGVDNYLCNFCNHRALCNGSKVTEINCRTCARIDVVPDGFSCQHGTSLCHKHVIHPQLMDLAQLPLQQLHVQNGMEILDYGRFTQGGSIDGKPCLASAQIKEAKDAGFIQDDGFVELLSVFDARIETVKEDPE